MNDRPRYTCTREAPWRAELGAAQHPDAKSRGMDIEIDGIPYAPKECPNCGHRWVEELPQ